MEKSFSRDWGIRLVYEYIIHINIESEPLRCRQEGDEYPKDVFCYQLDVKGPYLNGPGSMNSALYGHKGVKIGLVQSIQNKLIPGFKVRLQSTHLYW